MIKAALIDMDGVLYDSMKYHTLAWRQMMSEIGIECNRDEFYLYEGMTGKATIDLIFRREYGHDCDPEEASRLYARKAQLFVEQGRKEVMPGAQKMIGELLRAGVKCVLVTGSAQSSLIDRLAEDYPGTFPEERRVTALDVSCGKPDPEPYLKGLALAGTTPEETIVIENAPLGVRAGVAAGLRTIAVTTGPIPREEFEKENATLIFDSMADFAESLPGLLRELPAFPRPLGSRVQKEIAARIDSELGTRLKTGVYASAEESRPGEDAPRKAMGPKQSLFVLTDRNLERILGKVWKESEVLRDAPRLAVVAGEESKSLGTLEEVWSWLGSEGATRGSILLNIGGGAVSDLGVFAGSTFKRGMARIENMPTTLLAMVDASIGGKSGINFGGLKNEVGVINPSVSLLTIPGLLGSLSRRELLSGYAEMLKSGLISSAALYRRLMRNMGENIADPSRMGREIRDVQRIKEEITGEDPYENGERKKLNFGHTAGHAFESLSLEKGCAVTHGEAVAHGILVAMILSHTILGFPSGELYPYAEMLKEWYGELRVDCRDTERLLELMRHDKKNRVVGGLINFTLLEEIGEARIDCMVDAEEVAAALDIYRDLAARL